MQKDEEKLTMLLLFSSKIVCLFMLENTHYVPLLFSLIIFTKLFPIFQPITFLFHLFHKFNYFHLLFIIIYYWLTLKFWL